ncbi:hypothetical protein A2U01_0059993, partial [Trifolium medium]|nr:hypothetical protein [Trifolium medium]
CKEVSIGGCFSGIEGVQGGPLLYSWGLQFDEKVGRAERDRLGSGVL